MVSLIRNGPSMVLISTDNPEPLCHYYTEQLQGLSGTLNVLFDKAGEDTSILIFTNETLEKPITLEHITHAVLIAREMEWVLCKTITDGFSKHIKAARTAPPLILMRGIGNVEKILNKLTHEYSGETGTLEELLSAHTDRGVVVALTEKPLHRTCNIEDLYPQLLHIDKPHGEVYRELRADALKYLNEGIDNRDWNELEIRIFDRVSIYGLHYKRLVNIINALELGIILGESWGKDSPRFLMTVDVYRVRFFTFMDPNEIKKILVGLEHLEKGIRIVDYDVYYNRKKIYWADANRGEAKTREALSALYRNRILEKLTEDEKKELKELEVRIKSLQD